MQKEFARLYERYLDTDGPDDPYILSRMTVIEFIKMADRAILRLKQQGGTASTPSAPPVPAPSTP